MSALPAPKPDAADAVVEATVSVRALCAFAAKAGDLDLRFVPAPSALEGQAGHRLVQARRGAGYESEVVLEGFHRGLRVRGRADGFDAERGRVEEIKTHRGDLARLKDNHRALHRAQARVYAHLLCASRGLARLEVACVYFELASGEETPVVEQADAATLRQSFEALCERYLDWARQERAHRAARDGWLERLRFPHARFRDGQRGLAEAVWRAARGGSLLAEAPTGIGKTLATLFPLLKAMPVQGLHKLYFLTAKTTGRALALDGLAQLAGGRAAVPLRVVELVAREKACEQPGRACHGGDCPLAAGFYDRLGAARQAAAGEPMLTRETLAQVARRHGICPYYLGQEMVRWADVVVGDLNYYFDASAFLHALAREEEWRLGVLVDEAHNLLDRAREMYSATLTRPGLAAARALVPRALAAVLDRFGREWSLLVREQTLAHAVHERPPERLVRALQETVQALAEHLAEATQPAPPEPLARFFFDALHAVRLVEGFGPHALFETLRTADDAAAPPVEQLRVRNLVPAPYLAPRFAAAHALVAFSGTLQPMDFHVAQLGLPATTVRLSVPSPFDARQLQVRVATRLSTRWRDRGRSLGALVDCIAGQVRARPGNYLAFFGGFDYLQQAAQAFATRHADLEVFAQQRGMDEAARAAFIERLRPGGCRLGLAVLGGAFGEGIDLPGERLVGAFIAGLGLPRPDDANEAARERLEALHGDGWNAVYLYPGLQKVVQAAGRVIRGETDEGVLYLMDDRFMRPEVRALLPAWWAPRPLAGPVPASTGGLGPASAGGFGVAGLPGAADVHAGQHELQRDEAPGLRVQAPSGPGDVAGEEDPEAQLAPAVVAGGDVEGRGDAQGHGRPLQEVPGVHGGAVSPAASS